MKTYEELLEENESLIKENFHLKQTLSSKDTNELLEKELIKAIPDAIFLIDKKGTFLKFIPAKDFDSYVPPEIFLGKNIKDIFSEELGSKFLYYFDKLFETNETQIIEYELEGKYFEARFVISGNSNVISVVRDITTNKKSAVFTQKYNDLIAKAPFGFAYHKIILDEFNNPIDYEFLEINEAFELMTALKKSDVVNHKVTEVIPNIKEDSFNWIKFYSETALNGTEKDFEQYSEPLKRWYKVKVYSTEKYYFSTLFEDITFQKEEEKKVALIEKKYKSLIENAPDIVTVINSDLKVNYVSPSIKQIGYKMDTFLEQSPNELIHPDDINFVFKTLEKIKKNVSSKLTIEYRLKDGNDDWIWVESTFSNMLNDISIQGIVINSRNINDRKIYQDKLVESEDKFSKIFLLSPDIIMITSITDGFILEVNNSFLKTSEYSYKEAIGKTTQELGLWFDYEERNKLISLLIKNKKLENMGFYLKSKSGKIYNCLISSELLEINNEICILSVIKNVTDIYQVQQELHDREEIYSSIVNKASESIALIDFETFIFVEFNNSACSSLGYTKEEFKNLTLKDIQANEKIDGIKKRFKEVKEKGTVSIEKKHKTKDGKFLDIFASDTYLKIKEKEYISAIWTDITERNKIQKELLESEKRLKEAESIAKLGNWELDLKTNKLQWSDEVFNIFEIDRNKFNASYEDFLKSIHPDDRELVNQVYTDSLKNKTNYAIVHRILMKDGTIKHVQEIGHTDYDEHGLPSLFIGTVQDITDRVKIEEEIKLLNQNLEEKVKERTILLEQANKDLESFAYSVSHDLRAPLRHIDGFSTLLKNSLKNIPPESEQYFAKINKASNKMSKMIDDLLKFSRLGRKVLEKTDVDLNILVKEIIEQYKIDIVNRKIEFIVGNLPTIKGDKGLIQIVFENLISNAIKFTSKKDIASIEIGQIIKEAECTTIYIKDNGVGFDMNYVDKLFGVFQRLHTEQEFSGTGIGLANIKQIIKKHGGTIHAEGEVDKGATFYISL